MCDLKGIEYVCATPIETAQTLLKLAEAKEQAQLAVAIKSLEDSIESLEVLRVYLKKEQRDG